MTGRDLVDLDGIIRELSLGNRRWAAMDLAARRALLRRTHAAVAAHAQHWVSAACEYKLLEPESTLVGEEWISGPYAVLAALASLEKSLKALENGASPIDGMPLRSAPGGRVAVRVLPWEAADLLVMSGIRVQVWMPPGIDATTVRTKAGLGQRDPSEAGGVGVVLGAGNITSIPPLDVLYELIAHNRAVVLKLNPLTAPMLPAYQKALAPLIDMDVLRIVTGDAAVGEYLVQHADTSHVHITGSATTHSAIVYGCGPAGEQRRIAGQPLLHKEITSELGGVSPIIVVPGRWSKADLRFQAAHVATMRLHNGGYNCIAGQVLVVSSDWSQKEEFLAEVRAAILQAPQRVGYYPGSADRVAAARAAYPQAEASDRHRASDQQEASDRHWASDPAGAGRPVLSNRPVLIPDVPSQSGETAFTTEYFAPVLAVTELPGAGLTFLRAAIGFANEDLAGSLGANILIHPRLMRRLGATFEETVAALRYGTVAINTWTAVGFLSARAPWGAFAGNTLDQVGSGIGVVHNASLLDDPERTVVHGAFAPFPRSLLQGQWSLMPKPPWFVNNRTGAVTGRRLTEFAARPGLGKLVGVLVSAMRG